MAVTVTPARANKNRHSQLSEDLLSEATSLSAGKEARKRDTALNLIGIM